MLVLRYSLTNCESITPQVCYYVKSINTEHHSEVMSYGTAFDNHDENDSCDDSITECFHDNATMTEWSTFIFYSKHEKSLVIPQSGKQYIM